MLSIIDFSSSQTALASFFYRAKKLPSCQSHPHIHSFPSANNIHVSGAVEKRPTMIQKTRDPMKWSKRWSIRALLGLPILLFLGLNISSSLQGLPFSATEELAFAPPSESEAPEWISDNDTTVIKVDLPTVVAKADAPQRPITPPSSCTSPESNVTWPFQGSISSINPQHTCGLQPNIHPFTDFLIEWNQKQLNNTDTTCQTVLYGAAFGGTYLKSMVRQREILRNRAKFTARFEGCFHVFALQSQLAELKGFLTFFPKGIHIIGVPEEVLPFENHRRNVKLFKFLPQILFPHAHKIIWQDMKFFRGVQEFYKQPAKPLNVYETEEIKHDACLITTSLPVIDATLGDTWKYTSIPHLEMHCKYVVEALEARPNVTDSPRALQEQCNYYFQQKEKHVLDQGMIDSAFMVWHFERDHCKDFNAQLQCEILNQIHCFSDRDQISIPFSLSLMNLTKKVSSRDPSAMDNPRYHPYQLVRPETPEQNLVHVIQSACHWYFYQIGECVDYEENGPSLAVVVAGTLRRFQFKSTFDHLLLPAKAKAQLIDYYLTLDVGESRMYRSEGYSSRIIPDPFLNLPRKYGILKVVTKLNQRFWSEGFRASSRTMTIRNSTVEYQSDSRIKSRLQSDADFLKHFPAFDVRPDTGNSSEVGNSNMLSLFYAMEELFPKLLNAEQSRGKQYDYVLILRDDTLWMQNFSLSDILDYGRQVRSGSMPDAFVLSCDAREPAMVSLELCDHGILVHRSKAHIFTQYFTTLLSTDLSTCHAWARRVLGFQSDRGCNSEMILQFIVNRHNVSIQKVPQSMLPFERAATVRHKNGAVEQCLHKFCQSHELPLTIPSSFKRCSDIQFNNTAPATMVNARPTHELPEFQKGPQRGYLGGDSRSYRRRFPNSDWAVNALASPNSNKADHSRLRPNFDLPGVKSKPNIDTVSNVKVWERFHPQ